MIYRTITLASFLTVCMCWSANAQTMYEAILSGNQEVPAINTVASGQVASTLNGNQLVISGEFDHLSSKVDVNIAGGAHIHMAYAGENGSVVFPISIELNNDSMGGMIDDTFSLSSAQINALGDRQMYVNIHTINYPAGEIRGQLTPQANDHFFTHLRGAAEVPSVTTLGRGAVIVELHGDTLVLSGHFDSLGSKYDPNVAGGSHLHFGAAGTNGSITIALNPSLESDSLGGYIEADSNMYILTAPQIDSLKNMKMYVNIHTEDEPAGELRGQLMTLTYTTLMAQLSGIQEVPPISTNASGMVVLKLTGSQLMVAGKFMDLMSDYAFNIGGGAHLHMAPAGRNGNVVIPLNTEIDNNNRGGVLEADSNMFMLTPAQKSALMSRQMYVNIHSDGYPAGELRGQVTPMADMQLFASLYGSNEVPPVNTTAKGGVIMEIRGSTITVTGSFTGLMSDYATNVGGTGSGAHLHMGYAGENGSVEYTLTPMIDGSNRSGVFMPGDNTTTVTSAQMEVMMERQIYVNVHSNDHMPGELRGQVVPVVNSIQTTSLSGMNEVQPVMTDAMGGMLLEIEGDTLTVTGAFDDLGSDVATDIAGGVHLHMGGPAENGSVQIPLLVALDNDIRGGHFMADSNKYELTASQKMNIMNGDFYVNIHSDDFNSGELRGQVLNGGNMFPGMTTINSPAHGEVILIAGDSTTVAEINWRSVDDPDGNEVVYIYQFATDMNFTNLVRNVNVGTDTMYVTDYKTIDSILVANNVDVGSSMTFYHRVITSDGSVRNTGTLSEVDLERGTFTSIEEEMVGISHVRIYPNPAQEQITLEFDMQKEGAVRFEVYDLNGKRVLNKEFGQIRSGSANFSLGINQLNSGIYNYRIIRLNGAGVAAGRFEVNR